MGVLVSHSSVNLGETAVRLLPPRSKETHLKNVTRWTAETGWTMENARENEETETRRVLKRKPLSNDCLEL